MLHRRNVRHGQGWRVGNGSYEARKRHENHGDCGSAMDCRSRSARTRRTMRRWLVERFFAWIQWQRRILIRWEYHAHNFLGFVQLACLVILFKRFFRRVLASVCLAAALVWWI